MNKVYSTKKQGNVGIQGDKKDQFSIWIDLFYEFDFGLIDDMLFKTEKEAYDYLENKYGELKEINN